MFTKNPLPFLASLNTDNHVLSMDGYFSEELAHALIEDLVWSSNIHSVYLSKYLPEKILSVVLKGVILTNQIKQIYFSKETKSDTIHCALQIIKDCKFKKTIWTDRPTSEQKSFQKILGKTDISIKNY